MTELFAQTENASSKLGQPLAARMRPVELDSIVGQTHILDKGKLLRRAIDADRIGSTLFYGPPGCGKTSLAEVIAHATRRLFEQTSGVVANVSTLRTLLEGACQRRAIDGRQTILFIDEIHRFSKSQQDVLLPFVEDGSITLIGATTHNPFFFINAPLTSRSQIFQLEPLDSKAVYTLLIRALEIDDVLCKLLIQADDEALHHLASMCKGDARRALNALEIAVLTTPPDPDGTIRITLQVVEESIQQKAIIYDHDEDGHYDTISAFIKSIRGSDPDAAMYWLAKMLVAGEDPRFIARRLIILASEDIGNADPRALTLAVAAMESVGFIGMPEARITLAQATTYLSCAPKSNASYMAIEKAMSDVKNGRILPIPKHLRSTFRGSDRLGHTGYQYIHEHKNRFVDQTYASTSRVYYEPSDQGYEATIRKRMAQWDELRKEQKERPDQETAPRTRPG